MDCVVIVFAFCCFVVFDTPCVTVLCGVLSCLMPCSCPSYCYVQQCVGLAFCHCVWFIVILLMHYCLLSLFTVCYCCAQACVGLVTVILGR